MARGERDRFGRNQSNTDSQVAVKILHRELALQPEVLTRFQREAKIAAKINHVNAVRVLDADFDATNNVHFIIYELVNGENLETIMVNRGGKIEIPMALEMMRSVAKALVEAGRYGIVHRDIKPANIMVSMDGEFKLTDLGIAKLMESNSSLTRENDILGTPAFISPEQIYSSRTVDHRSDIYSLGATFFYLVTGEFPFTGKSKYRMLESIDENPTPHLCERIPDIPVSLDKLIFKMMEKSPHDRFQNAKELLIALDET